MAERPAAEGPGEPRDDSGVRTGAGRDQPELLARIRRGDAEAFERVAREEAPRLFRLAWRLTGRREDAEDLVQETLVRALPRLRGFEGRARLSTYLLRALANVWKNRLRSRRRSRVLSWLAPPGAGEESRPAAPEPADDAPTALERLEAEDRAERVRRAVLRLEPSRRWTLLLREVEERSYEEIAELTGVPVGTVRSRLARARDDLRRVLEDAG